MIILDTCILRGIGVGSSSADVLQTIRSVGAQRVGVPWLVMEELAAQHAVKYHERYEAAAQALETFRQCTPWTTPMPLGLADSDAVRQHWRTVYGAIAEVIPTSESALREAAFREANSLAPCKSTRSGGKSVKTGYRDAAIWISAIEYARANEDETVYFVSSNSSDFGGGAAYRYPMSEDLVGLEGRFVHLTALDDVVSRFAQPCETDEHRVIEILNRPGNLDEVTALVRSREELSIYTDAQFECTVSPAWNGGASGRRWASGWMELSGVLLDSVDDLSSYRIGDHEWCTATARWLLAGFALTENGRAGAAAVSSWPTRVLVTPSGSDDPRLTVLRSSQPQAVAEEKLELFPGVLRSAPLSAAVDWGDELPSGRREN